MSGCGIWEVTGRRHWSAMLLTWYQMTPSEYVDRYSSKIVALALVSLVGDDWWDDFLLRAGLMQGLILE